MPERGGFQTAARSCGYCSFIFAIRCGMMNPMAETTPTSEELRTELNDLRSTATRLIEQASRLMERCAELEDQISRGTQSPRSHDDCTPRDDSCLRVARLARTIATVLDPVGREQISPNKPVACLEYLRISPAQIH